MPTDPTDPFPVANILRAAVERARANGRSQSDVAREAGLKPQALSRALRDDRETQPSVVRAVLRVVGLKLVAVDAED